MKSQWQQFLQQQKQQQERMQQAAWMEQQKRQQQMAQQARKQAQQHIDQRFSQVAQQAAILREQFTAGKLNQENRGGWSAPRATAGIVTMERIGCRAPLLV
jgi:Tfp pilus assembly protein PilE